MEIRNIKIQAGEKLYKRIMDGGFSLEEVTTVFAPASGPRFLVTAGFDLPVIKSGRLAKDKIVWLVGASSGAWRMAAWRQPEPEKAYQRLIESYIDISYTHGDNPQTLATSVREVLDAFIEEDALSFVFKPSYFRLAIIAARAKGIARWKNPVLQRVALLCCFLGNACSRQAMPLFYARAVFYTGVKPPPFCFHKGFRGSFFKMSEENFKHALLASAAVPLVVPPVKNIHGAAKGVYLDGGLTDYNIAQNYAANENDITLFFHHQERIIPNWMDKRLTKRQPRPQDTDNLLLVYPSKGFVMGLPDRKVPDRDDLKKYASDNNLRKQKWREAARLSTRLGEEFMEAIDSGKIRGMLGKL
ncbi:MAG: hypothetical protein K9K75_05000 [Deltaproteobacteria bacterium]|nr:hypothetical protein [Deltaproteobacteria bacterium]